MPNYVRITRNVRNKKHTKLKYVSTMTVSHLGALYFVKKTTHITIISLDTTRVFNYKINSQLVQLI